MFYLDITRLLDRVSSPSPTGIDRVELQYAKFMLKSGNCFAAQSGDDLTQVPTWLAEEVISHVHMRWDEGIEGDAALTKRIAAWRKGIKPKRGKVSGVEKFFKGLRGKTLRRRLELANVERDYIAKRAKGIPPGIAVCAVASAPRLFEYLLVPAKKPASEARFLTPPLFHSKVYINVGHSGLEKTKLLSMLSKCPGLRTIIYVHDLLPISHPHLFKDGDEPRHQRRMENVKAYANEVIVNSQFTKQQFELMFGPGTVRAVLEIGTPPGQARRPAVAQGRRDFVSIGTIEPRKNYPWLVGEWIKFCDAHPDLVGSERLTIFGKAGWLKDDEHEQLLSLIQSAPNVELLTGESDATVTGRLAGARAYLSAAEVEGWGMPLAEAFALGTPVIASDIPAHREVTCGRARYFNCSRPGELRALLLSCFDGNKYGDMVADARGFEAWSWDVHFAKFLKIATSE